MLEADPGPHPEEVETAVRTTLHRLITLLAQFLAAKLQEHKHGPPEASGRQDKTDRTSPLP